jgi:hypothetical protein
MRLPLYELIMELPSSRIPRLTLATLGSLKTSSWKPLMMIPSCAIYLGIGQRGSSILAIPMIHSKMIDPSTHPQRIVRGSSSS